MDLHEKKKKRQFPTKTIVSYQTKLELLDEEERMNNKNGTFAKAN